jgi:hypothetical protein
LHDLWRESLQGIWRISHLLRMVLFWASGFAQLVFPGSKRAAWRLRCDPAEADFALQPDLYSSGNLIVAGFVRRLRVETEPWDDSSQSAG